MPSYCHSCQHCECETYWWGDRNTKKPSPNGSHPVFVRTCTYNYKVSNDIQIHPWDYKYTPCPRYLAKG